MVVVALNVAGGKQRCRKACQGCDQNVVNRKVLNMKQWLNQPVASCQIGLVKSPTPQKQDTLESKMPEGAQPLPSCPFPKDFCPTIVREFGGKPARHMVLNFRGQAKC